MNSLALTLKTINLFLPHKLFSGKATNVGSPPNFPKPIWQLWRTLQPQYFVTLFLDPHWTYLWKYFTYYKKGTKVGSQHFGYQIWFCTRLVTNQSGTKPNLVAVTDKIKFISTPYESALSSMPQNTFDDKWPLVQVMTWCIHATSHYLSQYWLRYMLLYGNTRPQWVKIINSSHFFKHTYNIDNTTFHICIRMYRVKQIHCCAIKLVQLLVV